MDCFLHADGAVHAVQTYQLRLLEAQQLAMGDGQVRHVFDGMLQNRACDTESHAWHTAD
jgi:hypothetical protein